MTITISSPSVNGAISVLRTAILGQTRYDESSDTLRHVRNALRDLARLLDTEIERRAWLALHPESMQRSEHAEIRTAGNEIELRLLSDTARQRLTAFVGDDVENVLSFTDPGALAEAWNAIHNEEDTDART